MSDQPTPAASEDQDPPWPTMHPADDYDGHTDQAEDSDDNAQRMHEQLQVANDEHPGDGRS